MTAHDTELLSQAGANTSSVSVSVIICGYKLERLSDILEAIRSVQCQDVPPSELIVVVDHNPPLLAAIGESVRNEVLLTENFYERGLSGARNTGIAHATGDLVLFLDDDAVADPACLRQLAKRCLEPHVIGACALIEPVWPGSRPAWFPGEFLWIVGCSYNGLKAGQTRNLLGAAMCIRRDVFPKTGGFDSTLGRRHSDLPLGCEETELCIRASQAVAGGYFVFEPAARVAHKVSVDRLSLSYFARRCYAEGLSKAHLSHLVGTDHSLASERTYLRQTLPRAIAADLGAFLLRGDLSGLGRAATIVLGVGCAAAGFVIGRGRQIRRSVAAAQWADWRSRGSTRHRRGVMFRGSEARNDFSVWRGKAELLLREHIVLFSNAGLLALGTGVASFLGFFYWWLAARTFPASAVGSAAAAISLMNFIGHLGEVGLGALLIGEGHRFKERSGSFISAALVISGGCSALFGLCYIALSPAFPANDLDLGFGGGGLVFSLGCALTGLTLVLDQAMVGLLRSWLQVSRNVSFAVVKLALIALMPLWLGMSIYHDSTILTTWVVGQIASIILLFAIVRDELDSVLDRPDFGLVKLRLPGVVGHHGLNLANLAPGLLLPFVVAIVLSPSINAAFYAAWTMTTVAYLVPASLATVVFAVGAKSPYGLCAKVRASISTSMAIGVAVAIIFYAAPEFILGLFSQTYAQIGASSLSILGLSIFPVTIKYHYVSIQRLRNRMFSASLLVGFGCVLELAGAIVGGLNGNLFGLTVGWLIGLSAEAVLMTPVVLGCLLPGSTIWLRWPAVVRASAFAPRRLQLRKSEDCE
jgi:GT2 family glycosyltransferase/O-antigen/teichoic acid export membrane protein